MAGRVAAITRLGLVACLLLFVASCGDDSSVPDDRRFANDPTEEGAGPTVTPTEDAAPTEDASQAGKRETPGNPAGVLDIRGAPDGFFTFDDANISLVTLTGAEAGVTTWGARDGQRFLSIGGAPDVSRVAALVESVGGRIDLSIFDRNGTVLETREAILERPPIEATPFTDGTGGAPSIEFGVSVSWSPLGDAILVASSRGTLLSVPPSGGDVTTFDTTTNLDGLVSAEWSPRGDAIAALIRDRQGAGRLFTFDVDGANLTGTNLVDLEHVPDGNSIEDYAWSADGNSMFFVVADRQGGMETGGRLYATSIAERHMTLLVTSGRGGPSGSIGGFVPSPDGSAIAVVITVQESSGPRFHSLVVRSLEAGSTYDVPTGNVRMIPNVRWVDGGLAWLDRAASDASVTLATSSGEIAQLSPNASSSSASPEASPVDDGTPVARG